MKENNNNNNKQLVWSLLLVPFLLVPQLHKRQLMDYSSLVRLLQSQMVKVQALNSFPKHNILLLRSITHKHWQQQQQELTHSPQ